VPSPIIISRESCNGSPVGNMAERGTKGKRLGIPGISGNLDKNCLMVGQIIDLFKPNEFLKDYPGCGSN
jgi:hypothetical protein